MTKVKAPQLNTFHCHCREFHGAPTAGSSFHYDTQISNECQMTNAKKYLTLSGSKFKGSRFKVDAHVKSPFHMDLGIKVFGNYELFK